MGDGAEGLGLKFELVLGDEGVVVFGDGGDPVVDGEDVGAGWADGDKAGIGAEDLAEAGAVFIGGAGDGLVDGGNELVEGGGGWAGCRGWRWRLGVGCGEGCGAGEDEGEAAHGGSVIQRSALSVQQNGGIGRALRESRVVACCISSIMALVAAAGSLAWVMGRPMTR